MFLKLLTVAGLASFEIYAAIPAGFAMGLHPLGIFISSIIGGLAGVFVVAFFGDKINSRFRRNKIPKEKKTSGFAKKIWDKYGIIGLGFIGTMTVGAPLSLAVGVGMNAPIKKLVMWCCLGVLVRCAVFTTVGHLGMQLV
jgi:membrane protein YqaA with SNARE-associated domain